MRQPLTYSSWILFHNLWRITARCIDVKRVVAGLLEWEIFGFCDVEFDVEVICLGEVSFTFNFKTF